MVRRGLAVASARTITHPSDQLPSGTYKDVIVSLPGQLLKRDVVLGELVKARGNVEATSPIDAFLVAVSGADIPCLLDLAHRLRDANVSVEFSLKVQPVGKQLKLAAARGATQAIIIGPDEREKNEAVIRDLNSGAERRVALNRLMTNGQQELHGG